MEAILCMNVSKLAEETDWNYDSVANAQIWLDYDVLLPINLVPRGFLLIGPLNIILKSTLL